MSSGWSKIVNPIPENLHNIMFEEVAKDLKAKESKMYNNTAEPQAEFDNPSLEDEMLKLDAEIAKKLQRQFDKELNENLKTTQEKMNGVSKVSVSNSNYRRVPNNFGLESEDSEEEVEVEDIGVRMDWDRLETLQKEIYCIPRGYVIRKGKMITKRDMAMNNNREGFDLKLCNNIFNDFKMRHKVHDNKKQRATAIVGIDDTAIFLLNKMISSQLLEKINGVINIGKDKVVLHASSVPQYTTCSQSEWAINVFNATPYTLSDYKYIKDDYHFKDGRGKPNATQIINRSPEREMYNLLRLRKAGVLCPEVVGRKKHILITTFIGRNGKPAPTLSDAPMNELQYIVAYDQIVEQMRTLYNKANLIHTNLTEHKILWFDSNCYFLDVRRAVEPTHEKAFHFLMHDCENITNFFKRKGVPEVCNADTLFQYISGCDFTNRERPLKVQVSAPAKDVSYSFNNTWKKSKRGELLFK